MLFRSEGLLIQAFIPTATAITVKLTGNGKKYPMELADEAGFYAVLARRCLSATPYCTTRTSTRGVPRSSCSTSVRSIDRYRIFQSCI